MNFNKGFIKRDYKDNRERNKEASIKFTPENLLKYLVEYKNDEEFIIFDIGANIGQTAHFYKELFPNAKIHCFEPDIDSFNKLKENCKNLKNVYLNNVGIGDKNTFLTLYKHNINSELSGFHKVNMSSEDSISLKEENQKNNLEAYEKKFNNTQEMKVKVITLDDYVEQNNINHINLLKIDTQGFEVECFMGFKRHLKICKIILTEIMFFDYYEKNLSFYDIEKILIPNNFKFHNFYHVSNNPMNGRIDFVDALYVNKSYKSNNISNVNFKYKILEEPFKYMLIENFLDLKYLKKIDNYFDKVPETLYVQESVPQSVIQNLDINELKENDVIEVKCISEFSEKNKNMDNAKLKEIKIETRPNGQQGINRLFVDKNNIDLFPELFPLKNKLCSKEFTEFLEKSFNKDLSETRLKIELLRNKKDHFLLPHCDCVEKVVSFLIYINFNDQPLDSGTDVYIKKSDIIEDSTMKRSFENFETISTTPFINNSCFIFCGADNSWHGVNPGKTFTDRRLVQLNWVSKDFSSHSECFPVNQ